MFQRNIKANTKVSYAKSSVIKGSPQKINLVLKLLRGKTAPEALQILNRVRKYAAIDIKKTLLSAISNAENNGFVAIDELIIRHISVGKAIKLRRFCPRARGRIFAVNKHYSKIYIELHEVVEG